MNKESILENSCSKLDNLPTPLHSHAATLHSNNTLLVCGGWSKLRACYKLNSGNTTWTSAKEMLTGRSYFGMSSLSEVSIATGGNYPSATASESFRNGKWINIRDAPVKVWGLCSATIAPNQLLAIGGSPQDGGVSKTSFVH